MDGTFLERYLDAFARIEGWFSPDAALMFMAYGEVNASLGISANVLEIGVHHGLSAIAVSTMRGHGAEFVAIDLFDRMQAQNVSASGRGNRAHFDRNMRSFFGDTGFVRCLSAPSGTLRPAEIGSGFSFCHVDGGHTAAETFADLALCAQVMVPGGLLALDDYFNPSYPGVCEGAIRFWLANEGVLKPIATGFNKVLLQRQPADVDLNGAFDRRFPFIPHKTTIFWETPVRTFSSFAAFIDTAVSNPSRLEPARAFPLDVELTPGITDITASSGDGVVHVPVRVVNRSRLPVDTAAEGAPLGLSYHLMSGSGHDVQFDNRRNYFTPPLAAGEARTIDMVVDVPDAPGRYQVALDVVWEGMTWLSQHGLATPRIALRVL
jgi:methyltransferase family protein